MRSKHLLYKIRRVSASNEYTSCIIEIEIRSVPGDELAFSAKTAASTSSLVMVGCTSFALAFL